MKKLLYTAFLLLGFATYAEAQIVLDNQATVTNAKINREKTKLFVKMSVDFTNVDVKSNQEVSITPRLVSNTQHMDFPSIVVSGRKNLIYRARNKSDFYGENIQVIERKDKKYAQIIDYEYSFEFEPWMNGADFNILANDCGCSTTILSSNEYTVDNFLVVPAVLTPSVRYIEPEVEETKARSYEASAFIDFPVAKYNIIPTFRRNASELDKIKESIEKVAKDGDMSISTVKLTGYASPEGSYALNDRLSRQRTEALRTYLTQNLSTKNMPTFEVNNVAENWDGLVEAVEGSSLAYKNDILSIIKNVSDLDLRERELKKLDNGKVYRELLEYYYPALRKTSYEVKYVIRQFTITEARDLVWTDPSKLSLNEIFSVSRFYDNDSEEYGRLFEIAVEVFPYDHVANINASTSAILSGNFEKAKQHLGNILPHNRDHFYFNNIGIYYLFNEKYDDAIASFNKAIEMGSEDAQANLDMTIAKIDELKLLGQL